VSGGEEAGHLPDEGLGILEEEGVASAAVEHEGGVVEILDPDLGVVGRDHHVVPAIDVENRVLDGLQFRPHLVERGCQESARRGEHALRGCL
jgi:hypothetical protein